MDREIMAESGTTSGGLNFNASQLSYFLVIYLFIIIIYHYYYYYKFIRAAYLQSCVFIDV